MKTKRCVTGLRKKLIIMTMAGSTFAFPFGSCDFGDFQTTSTVTLSGREVVTFIVQSAVLTPVQNLVDRAINNFFDKLEGTDE